MVSGTCYRQMGSNIGVLWVVANYIVIIIIMHPEHNNTVHIAICTRDEFRQLHCNNGS